VSSGSRSPGDGDLEDQLWRNGELEAVILSFPTSFDERPPAVVPEEVGALSEWRRQVADGKRKVTDRDHLRNAAIREANARDYLKWGAMRAATEDRIRAAELVMMAVPDDAA
jgi:hypothetical protein